MKKNIEMVAMFCLLIFNLQNIVSQISRNGLSVFFLTENAVINQKFIGSYYENELSGMDSIFIVYYKLKECTDSIFLNYGCPYVSLFNGDAIITGPEFLYTPFNFQYPYVSIFLLNNADEKLELSKIEFLINKSEIDKKPLIVIPDYSVNQILQMKEGWSELLNPFIKDKIIDLESYESGQLLTKPREYTRSIASIGNSQAFYVESYVPFWLKRKDAVGALGSVEYNTEYETKHIIYYRSHIIISPIIAVLPRKF